MVHSRRAGISTHTRSFALHFPQSSPFSLGAPHLGQNPCVRLILYSVYLCVGDVSDEDDGVFVDDSGFEGDAADFFADDVCVCGTLKGTDDFFFGCGFASVEGFIYDDVALGTGESLSYEVCITCGNDCVTAGYFVYFEMHDRCVYYWVSEGIFVG